MENGTPTKIYGNKLCIGCGATCWGEMVHWDGSLVCTCCANNWAKYDNA